MSRLFAAIAVFVTGLVVGRAMRRRGAPGPNLGRYERAYWIAWMTRNTPALRMLSHRASQDAMRAAGSESQIRRVLRFWAKEVRSDDVDPSKRG